MHLLGSAGGPPARAIRHHGSSGETDCLLCNPPAKILLGFSLWGLCYENTRWFVFSLDCAFVRKVSFWGFWDLRMTWLGRKPELWGGG